MKRIYSVAFLATPRLQVDILVSGLTEETDYAGIYCYAHDDEDDGLGGTPNTMLYNAGGGAGPNNVYTIHQGSVTNGVSYKSARK